MQKTARAMPMLKFKVSLPRRQIKNPALYLFWLCAFASI